MYIVKEEFLVEDHKRDNEVRIKLVDFVREWAVEVFEEASKEETISRAGQVVRYYVLENRNLLEGVFNEIFIVDLTEFWVAVGGSKGVRDDIALYGIFCMLFGELDEKIGVEGSKLEGEIGYAPSMRIDLAERDTAESGGGFMFSWMSKGDKEEEEEEEEELEELEEDEIVEVEDNFVREDNVKKLTALAVVIVVVLVVALAWVIII